MQCFHADKMDETFPFWMKKSERDVVDDMFLAIQNIISGTATVSNVVISEICFQYKIRLYEDFPLIILQYEMKSDKKEGVPMIPIANYKEIGENVGLCNINPNTIHTNYEINVVDIKKNSTMISNFKQEVPELLSVLNNVEVNKDEELVSSDCAQNNQPSVTYSATSNCTESVSDCINDSDSSSSSFIERESNAVSQDDSKVTTSQTKECNRKCKTRSRNKRLKRIVKKKKNEKIKTGERRAVKEKRHSCRYCGKVFKWRNRKIVHERIHTGEKPFTCEACEKSFVELRKLNAHKRIHTGDKRFKCEKCHKCFTWVNQLTEHRRIHTGEKPFTCEICGTYFSRSFSLTRHLRIHTGEKPFKCSECDKSFILSSLLIQHKRTHTGETPFTCKECGKSFKTSSSLCRHKQIKKSCTQEGN